MPATPASASASRATCDRCALRRSAGGGQHPRQHAAARRICATASQWRSRPAVRHNDSSHGRAVDAWSRRASQVTQPERLLELPARREQAMRRAEVRTQGFAAGATPPATMVDSDASFACGWLSAMAHGFASRTRDRQGTPGWEGPMARSERNDGTRKDEQAAACAQARKGPRKQAGAVAIGRALAHTLTPLETWAAAGCSARRPPGEVWTSVSA